MAIMGFTNVNHDRLIALKQRSENTVEIIQFLHDDRNLLLFVMDISADMLSRRMFGIMEQMGEKPCLYIISPVVIKSDMTIPDVILNAIYHALPDRRSKG